MVARQVVELRVGGQTYRVVASSSPEHTARLGAMVHERVAQMSVGKNTTPQQAMFLAAMSLAEELCRVRDQSTALVGDVRERFQRIVTQVDGALASQGAGESAGEE